MDGDRLEAFILLTASLGVPLQLVTEAHLSDYNRSEWPMHPALKLLSGIHMSDYLRPYFMYHYGGALSMF